VCCAYLGQLFLSFKTLDGQGVWLWVDLPVEKNMVLLLGIIGWEIHQF
jgi:hypothetical protein